VISDLKRISLFVKVFQIFSLVDLGEENDRNLKMPAEIAAEKEAAGGTEVVEAAEKTTTQMAEQAGEKPSKVKNLRKRKRDNKIDKATNHLINLYTL
jgi:hypothetical protein